MKKTFALLLLFVFLTSACSSHPSENAVQTAISETEAAKPKKTSQPTVTKEPMSTPTPVKTPTEKPTITSTLIQAMIPGASPSLLLLALEDKGFDCSTSTKKDSEDILWICDDYEMDTNKYLRSMVMFYGKTQHAIDMVLISAVPFQLEKSHQYITNLFGYIATLPYDGADIEENRSWVETTLNENEELTDEIYDANGVNFTLYKNEFLYMMVIGEQEEDYFNMMMEGVAEDEDSADKLTSTPEIENTQQVETDDSKQGNIQFENGPMTLYDVSFSESSSYWVFIGYITNSSEKPATSAKAIITLRDSDGNMVASDSTYMQPGEIYQNEKAPFMAFISIKDAPSWETYDVQFEYSSYTPNAYKDIEVASVTEKQSSYYVLSGEIINIGEETSSYTKVIGIAFDESGRMIGWDSTYADLEKIPPEGRSPFDIYIDVGDSIPSSYEIYVEGMVK